MRTLRFDRDHPVWVTSDTHFGHRNIIQYCLRPWLTPIERREVIAGNRIRVCDDVLKLHDDALIEYTNNLVEKDHILIHGGDVAWGRSKLQEYRERLNCKNVYIVVGNHDEEEELRWFFGRERVFERVVVEHNSQKAVIDHYPGDSWQDSHKGAWHLFGHIHGVGNIRRKENPSWALSIDVGVDSHSYKPWSWENELVPMFAERRKSWQDWRSTLRDKVEGGMVAAGSV